MILQSGKQRRLKSEKQPSSNSFDLMENNLNDTSYDTAKSGKQRRLKPEK